MALNAAPVLIAGGGIGGLSSAVALAAVGIPSIVLERTPDKERTGSGIQLGPNATRIFARWGLGEALSAASCRPSKIIIRDGVQDRQIAEIPLGDEIERRHGSPYLVLHRSDLQDILYSAAQGSPCAIENCFDVKSWEDHKAGIKVIGSDGETRQGSALIGADGLWSTIRKRIAPDTEPHYAGYSAWRALVSADAVSGPFADNLVGLWLGPGSHLVHYPIRRGQAINVVAIFRDSCAQTEWEGLADAARLRSAFANWCRPVCELLDATDDWRIWPLYGRPPLRNWSKGRATLLGDAAHPVLPYLAQGAALAIEDAYCLARALNANDATIENAFRVYKDSRKRHTARVQRHARRLGILYHLTWPWNVVRNTTLAAKRPDALLASLDWLYARGN